MMNALASPAPASSMPAKAPSAIGKVLVYHLNDVVRSRWAIAYTLFFLPVTDALFRFGGGGI